MNFATQSSVFQNEDMSCKESTEKLLPYGPRHMATHACGKGLCCSPRSCFSAWLFFLHSVFVIFLRGFVSYILYFSAPYFCGQTVSAKLAGGRFIYARNGVTHFRLSRFAIAIADIIKWAGVCTSAGLILTLKNRELILSFTILAWETWKRIDLLVWRID